MKKKKRKSYIQNKIKRLGKTDSLGNTERLGKTDSLGNTDGLGKITPNEDLSLKKVRGRREFFDTIKEYIRQEGKVSHQKLMAYFQYTTGATAPSLVNALNVLIELNLIDVVEDEYRPSQYNNYYRVKE